MTRLKGQRGPTHVVFVNLKLPSSCPPPFFPSLQPCPFSAANPPPIQLIQPPRLAKPHSAARPTAGVRRARAAAGCTCSRGGSFSPTRVGGRADRVRRQETLSTAQGKLKVAIAAEKAADEVRAVVGSSGEGRKLMFATGASQVTFSYESCASRDRQARERSEGGVETREDQDADGASLLLSSLHEELMEVAGEQDSEGGGQAVEALSGGFGCAGVSSCLLFMRLRFKTRPGTSSDPLRQSTVCACSPRALYGCVGARAGQWSRGREVARQPERGAKRSSPQAVPSLTRAGTVL